MRTILVLIFVINILILSLIITILIKDREPYLSPPQLSQATHFNRQKQLIPYLQIKVLITDDEEFPKVPERMYNAIKRWIDINPEYDFILLDRKACENFLKKYFISDILEAFNTLKPNAYKCDLFRYCWLYIHGGIYSDSKMELRLPLREIISPDVSFIVAKDILLKNGDGFPLLNGFIATVPGHPFLKATIKDVVNNVKQKWYGNNALDPTGPYAFGRAVNRVLNSNRPFIEGVHQLPVFPSDLRDDFRFSKAKYEILNFQVITTGYNSWIKRGETKLIRGKYHNDKGKFTEIKNSNIYWKLHNNHDIYSK
jgi:mannosyltransferase OCH1-like enzyme